MKNIIIAILYKLKNMNNLKYYADGFKQIAEKSKHKEEVDNIIKNGSLKDLENKLFEIKQLADIDRKDETQQSFKSWGFFITSILSIYLAVNFSMIWLFLAIPISLLSIAIIFTKYLKNPMYLFFIFDYGMMDYIDGKRSDSMSEPIYSYIYMEMKLKIRLSKIKT